MIDLPALRDKYVEMKRLRVTHDAGDAADPRPAMRALAARFPGALREIDALPMIVIEARIDAIERAIARGEVEPWMIALARYHAWMRFALRLRRACAPHRDRSRARAWLASARPEHADDVVDLAQLDDATLAAVLRPPGGRLHVVVLARVAAELEIDPLAIDALLAGRLA